MPPPRNKATSACVHTSRRVGPVPVDKHHAESRRRVRCYCTSARDPVLPMHGSCSPWPQLNLNRTRLALDGEGITAANIVQDPCMRVVTIHALTVHLVLCVQSMIRATMGTA
jgi:hypothetical protein